MKQLQNVCERLGVVKYGAYAHPLHQRMCTSANREWTVQPQHRMHVWTKMSPDVITTAGSPDSKVACAAGN